MRTLFEEALRRPAGAEREAYLDGNRAGQSELRGNVESLLVAHEGAGSFFGDSSRRLVNGGRDGAAVRRAGDGGEGVPIARYCDEKPTKVSVAPTE